MQDPYVGGRICDFGLFRGVYDILRVDGLLYVLHL